MNYLMKVTSKSKRDTIFAAADKIGIEIYPGTRKHQNISRYPALSIYDHGKLKLSASSTTENGLHQRWISKPATFIEILQYLKDKSKNTGTTKFPEQRIKIPKQVDTDDNLLLI